MKIEKQKIGEYVQKNKNKIGLILTLILSLLFIILDTYYQKKFMDWSISFSIFLQKIDAEDLSRFFSYIFFFLIFVYIYILLSIKTNIEETFTLIFAVFFLIYAQGFLKLIFVQARPVFLSLQLKRDFCYCDYGMPSGHSLVSTGLFLLIIRDIQETYSPRVLVVRVIRVLCFSFVLMIMLSRIWYGQHSFNQCIIGATLGALFYFFLINKNDFLLKKLIWPIIYKERFRYKNAFAWISVLLIVSNYLLLSAWTFVYTVYESADQFREICLNCVAKCLPNEETLRSNFSSKITRETLIFNYFFGVIIGVFMNRENVFSYKGLFADKNIKKYLIRFLIYCIFFSPFILCIYPKLQHPFLNFSRTIIISLLVGVSTMTTYLWVLKKMNLYPQFTYVDETTTMYIN